VTEETGRRFGLKFVEAERTDYEGISGQTFPTTWKTTITFYGRGNEMIRADFRVLPPEASVTNPLVGKAFIDTFYGLLFDEQPGNHVQYTALAKPKVCNCFPLGACQWRTFRFGSHG
jgi:hypothetical protein